MHAADLDPHAILAALGYAGADVVAPVAGGWDAALWRVERGGATFALRVFPAGREADAEREALAMRAAARAAPVPAPRARGAWRGRPALLLDWVPGAPLAEALHAAPWRARRLGVAFGRAQAAIHRASAPPELRDPHRDWIALAGPEEAALQARLRALPRRADVNSLLHLDYHPLNVMLAGETISGVLDWTNARAGDPRADLARTCSILRLMAGGPDGPTPLEAATLRAFEAGWRQGYGRRRPEMALFMAWAGAMMQHDLAPKLGRPGVWLTEQHLDAVRRWTNGWKRRAGLPC